MALVGSFEDDDAKAEELPSDEEGDPSTGQRRKPVKNQLKPKLPPPVSGVQTIISADAYELPSPTLNQLHYGPNSMEMRAYSNHIPSKTLPVSIPQFWVCSVCTFAENNLIAPVCGICGALPPMDGVSSSKPSKKRKKPSLKLRKSPKLQGARSSGRSHARTLSEQIPHKLLSPHNADVMLPGFLQDDIKQSSASQLAALSSSSAKLSTLSDLVMQTTQSQATKTQLNTLLATLSSKKEMHIELYSMKMTLHKKMKLHNTRIIALEKQKSKLQTEFNIQAKLWDKYYIILLQKLCHAYFTKLLALVDIRVAIEQLWLRCYGRKQQTICEAYDTLDEMIEEWDMERTREYALELMTSAAQCCVEASEMQSMQSQADKMKEKINKMETKYEEKKEIYSKAKVDDKKRAAFVILYLKRVMDEFNKRNKNVKLTGKFFCRPDVQQNFASFLLDQRVPVGKLVNDWAQFVREHETLSLRDIWMFAKRVLVLFCKLYDVLEMKEDEKYGNCYDYCFRFVCVTLVNLEVVEQALKRILDTDSGKSELAMMSNHSDYALFVHLCKLKYEAKS